MKNIYTILICLIMLGLLNGCFGKRMYAVLADNGYWSMYDGIDGITGRYYINISNFDKEKRLTVQIDRLSPNKNIENCKEAFDLNIGIGFSANEAEKGKAINYLKNNQIVLDTSKVFIIKNGKKYKVNLQQPSDEMLQLIKEEKVLIDPIYKKNISDMWADNKIDISNMLLLKINRVNFGNSIYIGVEVSRRYDLQFGCAALENTILIIDGIYLNSEKLEPIEIKLSYKQN